MIYKFLLLSDEIEDFRREITIDSDATFFDLHNAILDSVNYTKDQMTSFFTCDEDWSKLTEVTLIEMDTSSEEDSYVMDKTKLSELLDEEKQKLIYVFDYLSERVFFMELKEIIPGKNQKQAVCTKSTGEAPKQVSSIDDLDKSSFRDSDIEENFYGDEDFDMDELDKDGFDGFSEENSNPYDDNY